MTIGETRQRPKTKNKIINSQACEGKRFFFTQDVFDLDFHNSTFVSSFWCFWRGSFEKPNQVFFFFFDLSNRLLAQVQIHRQEADHVVQPRCSRRKCLLFSQTLVRVPHALPPGIPGGPLALGFLCVHSSFSCVLGIVFARTCRMEKGRAISRRPCFENWAPEPPKVAHRDRKKEA